MENTNKKLVIFGIEDFADIAFEYFTHDSDYTVSAFTVNEKYLTQPTKCDLPVIAFEDIEKQYPPEEYYAFVAVVYGKLNRIRADICSKFKEKGYTLATYVSSKAFVWRNVKIGENCFIFEDNTIQPFVEIGDNNILWSGNHIGHHSKIGNHIFISSHVVVSGWNKIDDFCFIGVNSTLANNTTVGSGCWINHGSIISGSIPEGSFIRGVTSKIGPLNEESLFRKLEAVSQSRD